VTSVVGIIWLDITFIVMFSLAYGKNKIGKKITSERPSISQAL
jgi:hypothetical protein